MIDSGVPGAGRCARPETPLATPVPGRDSGRLLPPLWLPSLLVAGLVAAGCRTSPTAPASAGPARDELPSVSAQVPILRGLTFDIVGDTLWVTGHLVRRDIHQRTFYDPNTPGGWALQLFIDADQRPTGYAGGFDFVLRGGECASGSLMPRMEREVPIRRTEGTPEGPGGWGPVTATVELRASGMMVRFPIPLSALDGDDGTFDWVLETYATVPCVGCESPVTSVFVDGYHGSTSARRWIADAYGPGRRATPLGLVRVR